jgi:SH3 domain protein
MSFRVLMRYFCLFCLATLLSPQLVAEESRYVTDFIRFSLRAGPDSKSKFITGVPSGSKVDVLEYVEDGKHVKIRTESGTVGYMEKRRLQKEPSYKQRYLELVEQPGVAEKKEQPTLSEPAQPSGDGVTAQVQAPQCERQDAELEQLRKELETIRRTSANVIKISAERNDLRQQLTNLSREKAETEQRLLEVGNNTQQSWFMIGAGVLVGGIVLGLLLPNLRTRRQKSYLSGL